MSAFSTSCDRLQTDYLDLFMLHWPEVKSGLDRKECLTETWRALELLIDAERCGAIGVSNFQVEHLEELEEFASILPHVNQCEFHPYQNPTHLRKYCQENKIQFQVSRDNSKITKIEKGYHFFQGFCPLAKGRILQEASIVKISEELGMTPAQLLIRWSAQNNVVTIPKSTNRSRVYENIQVCKMIKNCCNFVTHFDFLFIY